MEDAQQIPKVSSRKVLKEQACDSPTGICSDAHSLNGDHSWKGAAMHQNSGFFQNLKTLLERFRVLSLQARIAVVPHPIVDAHLRK